MTIGNHKILILSKLLLSKFCKNIFKEWFYKFINTF